jgi:hypothetical protein
MAVTKGRAVGQRMVAGKKNAKAGLRKAGQRPALSKRSQNANAKGMATSLYGTMRKEGQRAAAQGLADRLLIKGVAKRGGKYTKAQKAAMAAKKAAKKAAK